MFMADVVLIALSPCFDALGVVSTFLLRYLSVQKGGACVRVLLLNAALVILVVMCNNIII